MSVDFYVVLPADGWPTSVICFDGFGFEPQGNSSGRSDFAGNLLAAAEALQSLE